MVNQIASIFYINCVVKSNMTISSLTHIHDAHFTDITISIIIIIIIVNFNNVCCSLNVLIFHSSIGKFPILAIQRAEKDNLEFPELRNTERFNSVYFLVNISTTTK